MNEKIQNLMNFLDASVSVYHAVDYLKNTLEKNGYTRLWESENWQLVPGGKYYLIRGGSTLLAFRIPTQTPVGFMMSASHADRSTFKVKENGEMATEYTRLATEKYGGMLMYTWLDRPLSIAGRMLVETEEGVREQLVNIDRDLLLIPNVAIHMNRSVNEGYKWNPAVDTVPLLGGKNVRGKLRAMLEEMAGGKILGHDLYLYNRQKATIWGTEEAYISSASLDDLECAWGCTQGFLRAAESRSVPLLCVFDSEEVGSNSVQGAASTLLELTLDRICQSIGVSLHQMLAQSYMVSADNAHALHPNHPEYADSAHAPLMGGGVVLKFNAAQRYVTDGISAAIWRKVCSKAQVPVQTFYNRPDVPGGSTLGYISLSHVSVPTADVGLAQLAMHSCYETAAVDDFLYLDQAMEKYFGLTLECREGQYLIQE